MFVTGLEFLPVASGGLPITSSAEAAVVSISVDNRVCIHSLAFRSEYNLRKPTHLNRQEHNFSGTFHAIIRDVLFPLLLSLA
jgi:hypothetical protein